MQGLRYLEEAVTLTLDAEKCNGCRQCTLVCPHGVFAIGDDKRAYLADRGACMECGACALNCSTGAITVAAGRRLRRRDHPQLDLRRRADAAAAPPRASRARAARAAATRHGTRLVRRLLLERRPRHAAERGPRTRAHRAPCGLLRRVGRQQRVDRAARTELIASPPTGPVSQTRE